MMMMMMMMTVNVCAQVNGQSLLGATHQEAVRALQSPSTTVSLLVCDGYNDRNVTAGKPANGLSTQVCITLDSVCAELTN